MDNKLTEANSRLKAFEEEAFILYLQHELAYIKEQRRFLDKKDRSLKALEETTELEYRDRFYNDDDIATQSPLYRSYLQKAMNNK